MRGISGAVLGGSLGMHFVQNPMSFEDILVLVTKLTRVRRVEM